MRQARKGAERRRPMKKKEEVEEKRNEIADAIRSLTDTLGRYFDELNHAVRQQTDLLSDLANAIDPLRLQSSIEEPEVEVLDPELLQTASFVITQGDKVLCRDCFKREFYEPDPTTHSYSTLKYGVCSYCDLEIEQPKAMADLKREVSEVERDLNIPEGE
jgi:hypothetical protein